MPLAVTLKETHGSNGPQLGPVLAGGSALAAMLMLSMNSVRSITFTDLIFIASFLLLYSL
jgi:hypothetical protein